MKKLGKLTVNEMRDYVPLNSEEQMAMKGGVMTPYQWAYVIYYSWKIAKDVRDMIKESQSPSPSGSSATKIYGADSVVTADGTKIYYPDSVYLGSGN